MIDGQVMVTHHYGDTITERSDMSNTGIIHNDVEVLSDEETITTTPAAAAPVVSYTTTTTADHHQDQQHSEKTTSAPAAEVPVVSYTTVDGVVVSLSDILDGLHDV